MTDDPSNIDLTRRKALAALGSIGVASAGAGLGTSAYFSDQETFENNQLTAGTLDMKLAWQTHYSDWSADEAQFAHMPNEEETPTFRLPANGTDAQPIELVVEDGQGFLGSTRESRVNGGVFADVPLCGTDSDVPDEQVLVELGDVKPGDFGGAGFRFELCTNPGYIWLTGGLREALENEPTEPEADDPDEQPGVVELLDAMRVAIGIGTTSDLTATQPANLLPNAAPDDGTLELIETMSLRTFLQRLGTGPGILLDGDPATPAPNCFDGTTQYYASVAWWLPVDHANQVQSDEVRFDLGFYTEQCRHNDAGAGNSSLVTYYQFDGDATDSSGNGFDGTVSGAAPAPGVGGSGAYAFSPAADHVDIPPEIARETFAVSAWVNLSDLNDWRPWLVVGDYSQNGRNVWIGADDSGSGDLFFGMNTKDGDYHADSTSGGPLTTDTWTHVVAQFDGTTKEIYVDGSPVLSNDIGDRRAVTDVQIASVGRGHAFGNQMVGRIDELQYYDRALSASEIQALANAN